MRMRKLPWAEAYIAQAPVVHHEPQREQGKWKQLLNCTSLHVELGCGKGDYLIAMSKRSEDGWIGVEKDINVAAIAARKYMRDEQASTQVRLIHGDAQQICDWFAEGEIDVLHLNFSDPWPKKKAHTKRLSHAAFIAAYRRVVHERGEIQMKTDNAQLFEFSILQFQEGGWYLHDISVDFRRTPHEEDAITEYEQRFLSLHQPIYRAVWRKYPYVNSDKKKR
ncbi:MAG: tRNA (guanosine(46)-N7)-methyltransferase TrmB [Erysipelotrichaceae bacterium]|nr:tRNA (guanosine(46)-N7)-methyltransferase TrmB [Erysipelotrichaceae bacterium]